MIRVNFIGTAGGLGVTTLTVLAAQVCDGMAVERGMPGDMAAVLGVEHAPEEIFRHRFGDEGLVFADCGRDVPAPTDRWHHVLVVPRRYVGLRQAPRIIASGLPILGFVDAVTGSEVLSLADVRGVMGDLTHLGSMTHSPAMARVIDAGLTSVRMPKHAVVEATRITAAIHRALEDA